MTVAEQTPTIQHIAGGATTAFAFDFNIPDETSAYVALDGVAQTVNVDFTIAGLNDEAGGTVTFTSAPAADTVVDIERREAYTRTTDYQQNGDLLAETVNNDIDKAVRLIQQVKALVARVASFPSGTEFASYDLPAPTANYLLGWSSSAPYSLANYTSANITNVTASAYMMGLLVTANEAAAKAYLGFGTIAAYNVTAMPTMRLDTTERLEFDPDETGTASPPTGTNPGDGTVLDLSRNTGQDFIGLDSAYRQWRSTGVSFDWYHNDGSGTWRIGMRLSVTTAANSAELQVYGNVKMAYPSGNYAGEHDLGQRDCLIQTQNANYTFALNDRGNCVKKTNTTAYAYTVPPNASTAFPIGSIIKVINEGSAGVITITQGAGVTIRLAGSSSTGNRTVAAYGECVLHKTDTNVWTCGGAGTT